MLSDSLPPHDLTWSGVVYTLIVAVPSILAAWAGLRNRASLQTGSQKTVGEIATEVHEHVTAAPPAAPLVPDDGTQPLG